MRTLLFIPAVILLIIAGACNHGNENQQSKPNILIAIADDASYPHMGSYGTDWIQTPAFDRIADNGLLFNNCYTPNAKCAPSRACLLTGRNSWQLEAAANHWPYFPAGYRSFMEALEAAGYHTGHTAKGWAPGIAVDDSGEARHLTGPAYNEIRNEPPTAHISPIDYAGNFRLFLDDNQQGEPFCFWYGGLEPHRAYEFKSGIRKGKKTETIDRVPGFWPDNLTVRTDLLDYALEIEWFDRHLGEMLKELDQRGLLENTLVIVTSDNGMPFPRVKGQAYEYSNHMPMAIMWPEGITNPGRDIDDFISFIDVAPTLMEIVGITAETVGMKPIQGRSFTDIFTATDHGRVDPDRNHVLIGKERHDIGRPNDVGYPVRGIVREEYLLVRNFEPDRWPAGNPETGYLNTDGSPTKTWILEDRRAGSDAQWWSLNFGKRPEYELYHIKSDPECLQNLADSGNYRTVRNELNALLTRELIDQGDPRIIGQGDLFDEYPYADEKNRNFYERFMNGEQMPTGWVNPGDFESETTGLE